MTRFNRGGRIASRVPSTIIVGTGTSPGTCPPTFVITETELRSDSIKLKQIQFNDRNLRADQIALKQVQFNDGNLRSDLFTGISIITKSPELNLKADQFGGSTSGTVVRLQDLNLKADTATFTVIYQTPGTYSFTAQSTSLDAWAWGPGGKGGQASGGAGGLAGGTFGGLTKGTTVITVNVGNANVNSQTNSSVVQGANNVTGNLGGNASITTAGTGGTGTTSGVTNPQTLTGTAGTAPGTGALEGSGGPGGSGIIAAGVAGGAGSVATAGAGGAGGNATTRSAHPLWPPPNTAGGAGGAASGGAGVNGSLGSGGGGGGGAGTLGTPGTPGNPGSGGAGATSTGGQTQAGGNGQCALVFSI